MFLVLFGGNFFINKEAHGTLPLAVGFESCIETGRIDPSWEPKRCDIEESHG